MTSSGFGLSLEHAHGTTLFRKFLALVVSTLAAISCAPKPGAPVSYVHIGDTVAARQLLFGFYVADMPWCWTAPSFGVVLKPPVTRSNPGQHVELKVAYYLPDDQLANIGPVTISAETPGYKFQRKKISHGGSGEYRAPVPSWVLCTNLVPITFTLDKFAPASQRDSRNLGLVVSAIGLVARN